MLVVSVSRLRCNMAPGGRVFDHSAPGSIPHDLIRPDHAGTLPVLPVIKIIHPGVLLKEKQTVKILRSRFKLGQILNTKQE